MRTISCILTILTALLISISATAEKPRWASNGTASLEKERTNESYTFKNFETFNADINQLRSERFNPSWAISRTPTGLTPHQRKWSL